MNRFGELINNFFPCKAIRKESSYFRRWRHDAMLYFLLTILTQNDCLHCKAVVQNRSGPVWGQPRSRSECLLSVRQMLAQVLVLLSPFGRPDAVHGFWIPLMLLLLLQAFGERYLANKSLEISWYVFRNIGRGGRSLKNTTFEAVKWEKTWKCIWLSTKSGWRN